MIANGKVVGTLLTYTQGMGEEKLDIKAIIPNLYKANEAYPPSPIIPSAVELTLLVYAHCAVQHDDFDPHTKAHRDTLSAIFLTSLRFLRAQRAMAIYREIRSGHLAYIQDESDDGASDDQLMSPRKDVKDLNKKKDLAEKAYETGLTKLARAFEVGRRKFYDLRSDRAIKESEIEIREGVISKLETELNETAYAEEKLQAAHKIQALHSEYLKATRSYKPYAYQLEEIGMLVGVEPSTPKNLGRILRILMEKAPETPYVNLCEAGIKHLQLKQELTMTFKQLDIIPEQKGDDDFHTRVELLLSSCDAETRKRRRYVELSTLKNKVLGEIQRREAAIVSLRAERTKLQDKIEQRKSDFYRHNLIQITLDHFNEISEALVEKLGLEDLGFAEIEAHDQSLQFQEDAFKSYFGNLRREYDISNVQEVKFLPRNKTGGLYVVILAGITGVAGSIAYNNLSKTHQLAYQAIEQAERSNASPVVLIHDLPSEAENNTDLTKRIGVFFEHLTAYQRNPRSKEKSRELATEMGDVFNTTGDSSIHNFILQHATSAFDAKATVSSNPYKEWKAALSYGAGKGSKSYTSDPLKPKGPPPAKARPRRRTQ